MAAIILPRKHYTQPQGRVSVASEWSDAKTVWIGSDPYNDLIRGQLTPLGLVNRTIARNGAAMLSPSYAGANWLQVRTGNPATDNWPGVSVVFAVDTRFSTTSSSTYPSISSFMPSGELFGGWNLALDKDGIFTRRLVFRAGNSNNYLNLTGYNDGGDAFSGDGLLKGVATWDRSTISLHINSEAIGRRSVSNAHAFGWRSAESVENIAGYARSGNRSLTHDLLMVAVLPRRVSADEGVALADNPWQLFRADPVRIYSFAASLPPHVTHSLRRYEHLLPR